MRFRPAYFGTITLPLARLLGVVAPARRSALRIGISQVPCYACQMINVQIPLPDNVARDAEAAGLLTPRALALLIKEEIRRKAAQRLIAGAKRAAGLGARQISDAEITDIVREVRKARSMTGDRHAS